MTDEIDHEFRDDNFACPYCGYVFSDCWEWPDDGDDTCCDCNNKFSYSKDYQISYSTEKICEHVFTAVSSVDKNILSGVYSSVSHCTKCGAKSNVDS
jgi:hypothetical protein